MVDNEDLNDEIGDDIKEESFENVVYIRKNQIDPTAGI